MVDSLRNSVVRDLYGVSEDVVAKMEKRMLRWLGQIKGLVIG